MFDELTAKDIKKMEEEIISSRDFLLLEINS